MREQYGLGIIADRLLLRLPLDVNEANFDALDRLFLSTIMASGAACYVGVNLLGRVAPLRGRIAALTNTATSGTWVLLYCLGLELDSAPSDRRYYQYKENSADWTRRDKVAYTIRPFLSGISLAATIIGSGRFVNLVQSRGLTWSTVGVGMGAALGIADILGWELNV